MAKIISVATSKGGQGKSTTCVLLATTLSGEPFNKKVCIVDADPQKSIYNQRDFDLKNNPEAVTKFDVFDYSIESLDNHIDELKQAYDIILIDSSGHYDMNSKLSSQEIYKVLIYSDILFTPFVSGLYSIQSNIDFLKMAISIRGIKENTKYPLNIYGFLTMLESNRTASKNLLALVPQIQKQFNVKFLENNIKRLSGYAEVDTLESIYNENPKDTLGLNLKPFIAEVTKYINKR